MVSRWGLFNLCERGGKHLSERFMFFVSLLILIGLGTLSSVVCYGQAVGSYKLNSNLPLSPEGAKFADYFYTPSISATGSFPIEIGLYNVEIDGLKVPITLSYQTTGIQATQLSGSVGLGWSLNVGGGIYRNINGLPDEYTSESISTTFNSYYKPSKYTVDKIDPKSLYDQGIVESFAKNGADLNQDNYTYNFLGHLGGLFLNKDLKFRELVDSRLSFTYDSKFLKSLEARDEEGNVFNFRDIELSTIYQSGLGVSGVSSWKLSEITTLHNQKVNFIYDDYVTGYSYPSSSELFRIKGINVEPGNDCFNDRDWFRTEYANVNYKNKLITKVNTAHVTINFSYSMASEASVWKKKLDKIEIFNKRGELIKRILFKYGVFKGDPRLKLTTLVFEAVEGGNVETHEFLYHEERDLPHVGTMGKDAFGYFNGVDNTTLLRVTSLPYDVAPSYYNSNREVNEVYLKLGSLQEIKYPTSGRLKLYYSANRSGLYYAPGLRIDKTELINSDGGIIHTKAYQYELGVGLWIRFPDEARPMIPVSMLLNSRHSQK